MNDCETLRHVLAQLEDTASYEGCAHDKDFTPALQASLSIAISLRRIADVLEGSPMNPGLIMAMDDMLGRRL